MLGSPLPLSKLNAQGDVVLGQKYIGFGHLAGVCVETSGMPMACCMLEGLVTYSSHRLPPRNPFQAAASLSLSKLLGMRLAVSFGIWD